MGKPTDQDRAEEFCKRLTTGKALSSFNETSGGALRGSPRDSRTTEDEDEALPGEDVKRRPGYRKPGRSR